MFDSLSVKGLSQRFIAGGYLEDPQAEFYLYGLESTRSVHMLKCSARLIGSVDFS